MRVAALAGAMLLAGLAPAGAAGPGATPRVAYVGIVIDDLGNGWREAQATLDLPGPVACAVLPYTPFATRVADAAWHRGKEVLLHLPMEAEDEQASGPGGLDSHMPALEIRLTLEYDLESVPHATGVNNHMGSLLTAEEPPMRALMAALRARGHLFFLDSRTSAGSVAGRVAAQSGLPHLTRDVFLDNDRGRAGVERQLDALIARARRQGSAIAIGHPHPDTLAVLAERLPQLSREGVELVPLSALLALRRHTPAPGPVYAGRGPATAPSEDRR